MINTQQVKFEDITRGARRWSTFFVLAAIVTLSVGAGGTREEQSTDSDGRGEDNATRIEIEATDNQNDRQTMDDDDDTVTVPLDRPAWAVGVHENRELFQEEVSETIARGYVPVGMETNVEGQITILYAYSEENLPDGWLIESYTPDTINAEISQRLLNGWNPLAFSVLDGTFYVLFGTGESDEIAAWRIHQTTIDDDELQAALLSYKEQGYSVVDVSIDLSTNQFWYLFVKQDGRPGGPGSRIFVNSYPIGETTIAGISDDFSDGRGLPFAIASGSDISTVLFDATSILP